MAVVAFYADRDGVIKHADDSSTSHCFMTQHGQAFTLIVFQYIFGPRFGKYTLQNVRFVRKQGKSTKTIKK